MQIEMAERDDVKGDFLAALTRLRNGMPKNSKLIEDASNGVLKINPSSVALEAGRSRTLIGMEGCKYPEIRREVLASKDQSPLQMKRGAALKSLGLEIKRLEEQIRIKDTALVAAMMKIDELDRRIKTYEPQGKNVVKFPSHGKKP